MTDDPREIVAAGNSTAADQYAEWLVSRVNDPAGARYLAAFDGLLHRGANVLDRGCVGGGATGERLARDFRLTGIDISARWITLARQRIPTATFIHHDMTTVEFAPSSFDGVAAFYSAIHLPR